jgi:PRTRC genetic system protein E
MFKELGPLLRQRTVVMILTRLEDDTIRVNVIPRKLNESENDALTTPLSVAGTAEELDAELPSALVQFVGAHLELRNTLESAKEQMAAAAKTAKADARSKVTPKTAPVRTEQAPVETKRPADKAPEPAKPVPPKPASLFDLPTPATTPTAAPDESEEDDEPFVEIEDDEPTEDAEALDDAA